MDCMDPSHALCFLAGVFFAASTYFAGRGHGYYRGWVAGRVGKL